MKIVPNIPVLYEDKFPKDFVNDVNGWAFPKKLLKENLGKLLTLDMDFGNYCHLNCPHCFKKDNGHSIKSIIDTGKKNYLEYKEIIDIVEQAKKLGLRSLKFLGGGEPLLESDDYPFLEFIKCLKKNDITPLIFTKGDLFANDKLVRHYYHKKYGIATGWELIQALNECNASILLGFNAFTSEIQDKLVAKNGYTEKRNKALEMLVEAGFNKHNPTRLCLATNPVTNENYNEVLEIYKWGRVRNMYVIVCPSMISGRGRNWMSFTPSPEKLIRLYTDIYKFNIKKGIQTLEQIEEEGIASYAGSHPCNQVSCGLYITLEGNVLRCPGDEITIFANIREDKSLEKIWQKSENYGRAGIFNCGCPPKFGKTIHHNLFTDVMLNLKQKI